MKSRFRSLLWLRWQFMLSNKLFLFVVLSPVFDMALFANLLSFTDNVGFIGMGLNMIYSITAGSFVATMISEEKEKKNLKTLILSGVKQWEYILSVIFFPILFSMFSGIFIPILFHVKSINWVIFITITGLTIIVFILLNLLIALLSKSQSQTMVLSLGLFLLATFMPIFAIEIKGMDKVVDLSFIGANDRYLRELPNYQLFDKTFIALLIWILLTSIALYFAYKKNRKID
ncbi:ABC-2 type transport system permease protein [Streptococcus equinus]|uniref:ABC-2 type transport system permease protein n=1 Tax=Streptococcus equinus TaxID=1335 RepID=A0A1H0M043_STREI|nr:ABC transporter permease [Streptococcus equinus]SDO73560.1 ABC-2 type transport system permease protein [Streptococcus equinus]